MFARKYNRHILNAWRISTKGAWLLLPPLLYFTESKEIGDNQDRQDSNLPKNQRTTRSRVLYPHFSVKPGDAEEGQAGGVLLETQSGFPMPRWEGVGKEVEWLSDNNVTLMVNQDSEYLPL